VLLFSQKVFKSKVEDEDVAVRSVTFVGGLDSHTLAATSCKRLYVFSRLNLSAFELAASNNDTKEVTNVRRRARIATKDLTKYHGNSVVGMKATTSLNGSIRIYVYGKYGNNLITAWTVGKSTKLQIKLVGEIMRTDQSASIMKLSIMSNSSQLIVGEVRMENDENSSSTSTSTSTLLCWDSLDLKPIDMTITSNTTFENIVGMTSLRKNSTHLIICCESVNAITVHLLSVDAVEGRMFIF
jgi:hypothetical protein